MGIIATLIARTFEYGVPRESHERRLPPRGERREARLAPQPRPRRPRRRPRLGRRRRRKQQDVIRRGRCVPFPGESQKPQTPKRRRASFDASPSPGSRGANAIAASQCHGSPSRPLLSRTAVSRSNPRARCHRITT